MRVPVLLLLALPFGFPAWASGVCPGPFESPAAEAREIVMDLRAGDVMISGTDRPVIRVFCQVAGGNATENTGDGIRIRFAANHLTTRGGPHKDVRFRIEIPRRTNLVVRCPAGDFTVLGVTGDKDIRLNAGDLTIDVGDPSAYRHVEASVLAGDLNAAPFAVYKSGLFRSFNQDRTTGRYRLRAKLLAGDLTLK